MNEQQLTLMKRVEKAVGQHDPTWEDKETIAVGVGRAGGLGFATWDELDDETKAVIERVEKLPQTGWDDPSDVPDDVPDDF